MKHSILSLLIMSVFIYESANAQVDSLILKNHDVIVGEIKSMDRGVLAVETPYSDQDFKIEWEGVREIYTITSFLITLSDGRRYSGTLRSPEPEKIIIVDREVGEINAGLIDVVFLKSVDEGFWSRLYASIDLGYSFTKANNVQQVNVRSTLGYIAELWSANANYNHIRSSQDEVEPTRRTDGGLSFKRFLPDDWYLPADLTFLSNTEQKIDLRSNIKVGIGKYLIHTNNAYWGVGGGASFVNEKFSTEAPDRSSWEGYLGSELNLFDIGDLSLLTKVVAYPGITESGRWRIDFVFDTKYDLPLDFYIRLGLTVNYDNQPVESASDTDYVLQTSFGWEW